MNLEEHLLSVVKKDFDIDESIRLYEDCKSAREWWDETTLIGLLIYTNDYLRNKKLAGDTSVSGSMYNVNFVRDNLMHSIAESLIHEIDTQLVNIRKEVLPAQDLLELEMNIEIDRQRVVRQLLQVLICNKFMGYGTGKVYWDVDDIDSDWINGRPKHLPIDSRKMYYISKDNLEDKSDIIHYFHRERFTKQKFQAKYPEFYKKYEDFLTNTDEEDYTDDLKYYRELGIINVVTHQFVQGVEVDERAVSNEDPQSMEIQHFSKDEVDEYMREKGANEQNIGEYEKVLGQSEKTPLLPEAVRASVPLKRTENRWYQSIFIPEIITGVNGIELVGEESEYIIMAGNWHPNSQYSVSIAYDYETLLKLSGILLTTMALNTIKLQKPIPVVVEGALKNEANFLKNYHKIGVIAKVDTKWAEKNPTVKPVTWLAPPQAGEMQTFMFQLVEKMIDKSMDTPNVSRGVPDYAGQSGKQTELLQMKNAVSNKPDYYSVEEYLRKVADRYKNLIAKNRNYPHKVYLEKDKHIEGLTEIEGTKAVSEVNTNVDNNIEEVARRCFAKVHVESETEQKNLMQDERYEELYRNHDIDFSEFIYNQSWVKDPESLIESNKKAQPDMMLAQMINSSPELKQQVLAMIQELGVEAEQPDNVTVERKKVV